MSDRDESLGQAPLSLAASSAVQGPGRVRTTPNSRHQRLCRVCRHPAREAIEQDYLDWRSPSEIAIQFALAGRAWIDRHARATGLVELRKRNVRAALGRIIERAEETEPPKNPHSQPNSTRNTKRDRGALSD